MNEILEHGVAPRDDSANSSSSIHNGYPSNSANRCNTSPIASIKGPSKPIKTGNSDKAYSQKRKRRRKARKPKNRFRYSVEEYSEHYEAVLKSMKKKLDKRTIKKRYRDRLNTYLGLNEDSDLECAANIPGRLLLQKTLHHEFDELIKDRFQASDYDWEFITICDDRYATLERKPCVDLYDFKVRVGKALNAQDGWSYIAVLDVSIITRFPQKGLGGSQLWHWHVFAFRKKNPNKKRIFKTRKPKGFKTLISKKSVLPKPLKYKQDALRVSSYIAKLPYWGKTITTRLDKKTGESKLKMEDFPLPDANHFFQVAQILSRYHISELIISGGEGEPIIQKCLEKLKYENTHSHKTRLSAEKRQKKHQRVDDTWYQARSKRIRAQYSIPVVRMSKLDPKLTSEISKEVEPWLEGAVKKKLAERSPKKL